MRSHVFLAVFLSGICTIYGCKKSEFDSEDLVGVYAGTEKWGNSGNYATITVEPNPDAVNQIVIKGMVVGTVIAVLESSTSFSIPVNVYPVPPLSGGGGCGFCLTWPYLVKFYGHGELNGDKLTMTVSEYRRNADDEDFVFYWDIEYDLLKE